MHDDVIMHGSDCGFKEHKGVYHWAILQTPSYSYIYIYDVVMYIAIASF